MLINSLKQKIRHEDFLEKARRGAFAFKDAKDFVKQIRVIESNNQDSINDILKIFFARHPTAIPAYSPDDEFYKYTLPEINQDSRVDNNTILEWLNLIGKIKKLSFLRLDVATPSDFLLNLTQNLEKEPFFYLLASVVCKIHFTENYNTDSTRLTFLDLPFLNKFLAFIGDSLVDKKFSEDLLTFIDQLIELSKITKTDPEYTLNQNNLDRIRAEIDNLLKPNLLTSAEVKADALPEGVRLAKKGVNGNGSFLSRFRGTK